MPIDPATAILIGTQVAKTVGNGVKTVGVAAFAGGKKLHEYLKEAMPLDPVQEIGKEPFPELNVQIPESLNRKIQLLETTAKALETPDAYSMVIDIVNQINDDSYKVLIVGKYGTGKSTLLNRLMGRDILKTSAGETTKTLTWLMYAESAEKEAAWYHDINDNLFVFKKPEDIAGIPEEPPVFNMYAAVNADILKHGAVLIDTPGLHSSANTAAITTKAIENADAVILVYDHIPPERHDMELIEKLQKEGKGDKVFIVQNKMDNSLKPDQKESLIDERMEIFSKMGVRARIFPLSCKDLNAMDNGFEKFRTAIEEYLNNDLQKAKDSSLSHRIKNVSSYLHKQCEEAMEMNRLHDNEKRKGIVIDAEARIKQIQQDVDKTIRNNLGEINRMRNSVIDKWIYFSNTLKDEVNVIIQNATEAQLNQPNKLLGDIQIKISNFLQSEFYAAEYEVRKNIALALDNVQLPISQEEGRINVNIPARWDKNIKIPAELGTMGLLAYTFFTRANGFFSLLFSIPNLFLIFVLSPFINKIFEQILGAGNKIMTSKYKTQLQAKINEQWFTIDENARSKINEFFSALSDLMERCVKESVYEVTGHERSKIKMADTMKNDNKAQEFENYIRQLEVMEK